MKLADDEQKVADFFFKGTGDVANMSILTNRRLVVVYGNAEESYPLSKITAVKIIFNRSWRQVLLGSLLAVIGLTVFKSSAGAGLVAILAGAGLVYLGLLGKTNLWIGQMGGNKHYGKRGQAAKEMQDFVESVNAKLA